MPLTAKVTGWHDASSGFASGLDVCCHLSAMPLVLVCLLQRLVATENDWGQTMTVLSHPAVIAVKDDI